jgi:hypothetical protein
VTSLTAWALNSDVNVHRAFAIAILLTLSLRWVMPRADDAADGGLLIPQPLYNRLIRPTLEEWAHRIPLEASPHFWLGLKEHRREELRRVVELDLNQA